MRESRVAAARIVVLPGDGIGPEVTSAARRVLDAAASRAGIELDYVDDVVGGAAVDAYGVALRPQTLRLCKTADAILFGAVGGPKWDDAAPDSKLRPGSALLGLRKGLGLFANLRPVRVEAAMVATSALRPERVRGVDLLVVRELTGGLYFSRPKRRYMTARGEAAVDTMRYSTPEIERVAVRAFELARQRRRTLCSVDKANVLETSRLWRAVVSLVSQPRGCGAGDRARRLTCAGGRTAHRRYRARWREAGRDRGHGRRDRERAALAQDASEGYECRLDGARNPQTTRERLRVLESVTGEHADNRLGAIQAPGLCSLQEEGDGGSRGRLDQETFLARQASMRRHDFVVADGLDRAARLVTR